jgi:hypothetical protein
VVKRDEDRVVVLHKAQQPHLLRLIQDHTDINLSIGLTRPVREATRTTWYRWCELRCELGPLENHHLLAIHFVDSMTKRSQAHATTTKRQSASGGVMGGVAKSTDKKSKAAAEETGLTSMKVKLKAATPKPGERYYSL